MSSMHRIIDGAVLVRHLTDDDRMIDQELLRKHGRSARTLVKEGPLRLTLMALAPGGVLPAHSTEGPVTIHVLQGEVAFVAQGRGYSLSAGEVLVLAAGVTHSATSAAGTVFLLTIVHPPSAGSPVSGTESPT